MLLFWFIFLITANFAHLETNTTWVDRLDSPDLQFWTYITDSGRIVLPWVSLPGFRSSPICYDEAPARWENVARLAHLICRHKGSMVATRWFSVSKNAVKSNVTGLVISARCRGDEQSIGQCIWSQPVYWPCSDFLAIECGECSGFIEVKEGTVTSISSPGFPVYIPLTDCEWNVTSPPDYNVVLKFRQFDLPSPLYDEISDRMFCRHASFDLFLYHEAFNKLALEGRFCGKHSPGTLTLSSSQVIIRYSAGIFQPTFSSRKGFTLECAAVRAEEAQQHIVVSRWVLIGCGIFLCFIVVIVILICKRKVCARRYWLVFHPWRTSTQLDQVPLSSQRRRTTLSLSPPSTRRRRQTVFRSLRTNSNHCEKAKELENWKLKRKDSNQITANHIQMKSPDHTDSHLYEDVNIQGEAENKLAGTKSELETNLTNRRSPGLVQLHPVQSPTFQDSISLERSMQRIGTEQSYTYVESNLSLRPPPYDHALHVSGSPSRSLSSAGIYIDPMADE